jgi:uncharacterized membrane protein (UPF0127 family)
VAKKNIKARNQNIKKGSTKKTNKNIYKIAVAILIAAFALYMIINNFFPGKKPDNEFAFRKNGELTFADSAGTPKTKIEIQIANTEFDRELGLMYRKSMEENQGMLFIFPAESVQSFWMRNTYIPLDMIFVNSNKRIITIHKDTKTLSDQTYRSTAPAKYVIEVNAGFADKYNIKDGDEVKWTITGDLSAR